MLAYRAAKALPLPNGRGRAFVLPFRLSAAKGQNSAKLYSKRQVYSKENVEFTT